MHNASATLDWNPGLAEYGAGVLKPHIVIGITTSVFTFGIFRNKIKLRTNKDEGLSVPADLSLYAMESCAAC